MDYEIHSTPLIIPDSAYDWLCEQEVYKEAMSTDKIIGNRYIMKESALGGLYGNPKVVTPKSYAQEYLKNSKQTLFKGD
jgi:response regulator RpfG family c-di-GMP phosphodiesterase